MAVSSPTNPNQWTGLRRLGLCLSSSAHTALFSLHTYGNYLQMLSPLLKCFLLAYICATSTCQVEISPCMDHHQTPSFMILYKQALPPVFSSDARHHNYYVPSKTYKPHENRATNTRIQMKPNDPLQPTITQLLIKKKKTLILSRHATCQTHHSNHMDVIKHQHKFHTKIGIKSTK